MVLLIKCEICTVVISLTPFKANLCISNIMPEVYKQAVHTLTMFKTVWISLT